MKYEEAKAVLDNASKAIFTHGWSVERQADYDAALVGFRLAAEAVLGGTLCQSAEHPVPETTTNDAQRS
jgi:hypothetical protein